MPVGGTARTENEFAPSPVGLGSPVVVAAAELPVVISPAPPETGEPPRATFVRTCR